MGSMQVWEWGLLLVAVAIALRSLAWLMRVERDKVVAELSVEVEEQQRQKKEAERRERAKKKAAGGKRAA